ncbi:DEAD/DEAH box helicase family protein [uncultured Pseudonocardia sp.]|uniref:DEAD/DEAH box helicase family protein n=1 Tax=uncultured Pseudonocardia sp. TaxID=211455 RepID=UPI002633C823|nr:DEAD/DEAH box helicase family protein [uncultured Pseudonocardia sp.]
MTTPLDLHEDIVAEVAARLDLRDPNREAVQTLAAELSQYYDVDQQQPPFEVVIDSATGVGKTYVLTGSMELLVAAYGVRDFAVVTPGRTILDKTRDNFTPGHLKSLLGPMSFEPVVITADNFNTPAMRAAMDDGSRIKIYLFTVQSLIRPDTKSARKVHKFQEGLGGEFYAHLQAVTDLVVFADEHHCYYGPSFSAAIRDLSPWVLVGLTATPDKKTPASQIIFRYPLAAAIADRLVKTPVIVGRKDDRTDPLTKLSDGVALLQAKAEALDGYVAAKSLPPINPVMLVVATDTAEADEYGSILRSDEFYAGAYADAVLVVHSKAPDEALAALAGIEDVSSPVRIVISVGMLKEGWDVRNVYVIASMRASVSTVLTEQTLGRGMRLPFGVYTEVELLDTLEVVAHERYEDLLKKAGVLNQAFVDYRTRAVLRTNAKGEQVVVSETIETGGALVLPDLSNSGAAAPPSNGAAPSTTQALAVTPIEERKAEATKAALKLRQPVGRREDVPSIAVPVLRMTAVAAPFSLADITETDAFRKLGSSLAADPEAELSRTLVSARVETGPDGMRRTVTVTRAAADRVRSTPALFPLHDLRVQLAEMVLASPAVPARKEQRAALSPLLDAFFDGLGSKAVEVLSAHLGRAGARLIRLVETEQRRVMAKPSYDEVIELKAFTPARATDRTVSPDRFGTFIKSAAYNSWKRSLYAVEWFDSRPERDVANAVDEADDVACWVRLHIGELPILWNSAGRQYNPDFLVIEADRTHWVVEVKADKDMPSDEVQAKRHAARRWANHVTASDQVAVTWRYLLVSENDVASAKGSWSALKSLGS